MNKNCEHCDKLIAMNESRCPHCGGQLMGEGGSELQRHYQKLKKRSANLRRTIAKSTLPQDDPAMKFIRSFADDYDQMAREIEAALTTEHQQQSESEVVQPRALKVPEPKIVEPDFDTRTWF